jgi:alpha-N-arabinofuranosidase
MTPEEYCALYVRFVTFLRGFGGTEPVFVAVGPDSNDTSWTKRFLEALRIGRKFQAHVHSIAMHYYSWGASRDREFTPETLREQLATFDGLERGILDQQAVIDAYPGDARAGRTLLSVDDWGTWDKGDPEVEKSRGLLWQQGTMKDGVAAGLALNVFHRQADKLMMCNLAQLINVLQAPLLTDRDTCIRTPTFYVLRMCKGHRGKTSLRVENPDGTVPGLSVSASRDESTLVLTVVNPDHERPRDLRIRVARGSLSGARAEILHNPDWNACNTFERPDTIVPRAAPVQTERDAVRCTVPPLSVLSIHTLLKD